MGNDVTITFHFTPAEIDRGLGYILTGDDLREFQARHTAADALKRLGSLHINTALADRCGVPLELRSVALDMALAIIAQGIQEVRANEN